VIAYVDTSVLLRVALGQADALPEWRQVDRGVTSALTRVEGLRTLDRLRLRARLADAEVARRRAIILQLLDSLELVEVDSLVLDRAAQPPTHGAWDLGRHPFDHGPTLARDHGRSIGYGHSRRRPGYRCPSSWLQGGGCAEPALISGRLATETALEVGRERIASACARPAMRAKGEARAADQHHGLSALDVAAPGQFRDLRRRNLRRLN